MVMAVAHTHTHIHTQRVVVVLLLISTGFDATLGYPGEGPNNLDVRATLGGTVKVIKTRLQKLELSLDNVQTLITAETKDENRKGVLRLLHVLSRKIQRKLNSAERKKSGKRTGTLTSHNAKRTGTSTPRKTGTSTSSFSIRRNQAL